MKVKGSVVNSVKNYVKKNHPGRYKEWLSRLDPRSLEIIDDTVMATDWYPFDEAVVKPTQMAADLFFEGDRKKAAWEFGRFSSEEALTGIYKVFVMIATPQFIMKRGSKILTSFYDPSTLLVAEERPKGVDVHVTEFPGSNEVVEYRIGGWMQRALEICGCKNVQTEITEALSKGHEKTVYKINWD